MTKNDRALAVRDFHQKFRQPAPAEDRSERSFVESETERYVLQGAAVSIEQVSRHLRKEAALLGAPPAVVRAQCIVEEAGEVLRAMTRNDPYHLAHELADLLYVGYGSGVALAVSDLTEIAFDEVHRANMSKTSDGEPVVDESGRVVKGTDFVPADVRAAAEREG